MNKILFLVLGIYWLPVFSSAQNIGIGTTTPHASAMLDVNSTSRGLLVPRMTTAQKNAISAPVNGLLVYQTDSVAGFYVFELSSWKRLEGAVANAGNGLYKFQDS